MMKFCCSHLYLHSLETFAVTSFQELSAIYMYTSLIGIKFKREMCQAHTNNYCTTILSALRQKAGSKVLHLHKDIGEQISKKDKRRQQSSGLLYVVVVVKATPACIQVSTETVQLP